MIPSPSPSAGIESGSPQGSAPPDGLAPAVTCAGSRFDRDRGGRRAAVVPSMRKGTASIPPNRDDLGGTTWCHPLTSTRAGWRGFSPCSSVSPRALLGFPSRLDSGMGAGAKRGGTRWWRGEAKIRLRQCDGLAFRRGLLGSSDRRGGEEHQEAAKTHGLETRLWLPLRPAPARL